MTDLDEREVWKNEARGSVGVNQFGARGEVVQTLVRGGKTFNITTEERLKLNPVADDSNDPFKNGTLSVVAIADSAEDLEDIQANPNVVTESEMVTLVTGHYKTLEKNLAEIESAGVLDRFREVAIAQNVSVGTVQRIDDRIEELDILPTEGHVKFKAFTDGLKPRAASG